MKKTKVLFSVLVSVLMLYAVLPVSTQAAWRDYKFDCAKLTERPTLDGIINDGEYGSSQWILLDAAVDGGIWASSEETGVKASYIFSWMDDGIYIGVKVENDMTPNDQNGPATGGWWGLGDEVQIFFNPGYLITEGSPVLFDLGFNKDAKTAARRGGFNSETEGTYEDATSKIEGYSVAWKDGKYCLETFIPWSEILIKGMDRDSVKVTDLTTWTPAPGEEIGIMIVYFDCITVAAAKDGSLDQFAAYRSDVSGGWSAEEMGSISIILGDALIIENVADNAPIANNIEMQDTVAPATSDALIIFILIVTVSLAGFICLRKKLLVK